MTEVGLFSMSNIYSTHNKNEGRRVYHLLKISRTLRNCEKISKDEKEWIFADMSILKGKI